MFSSLPASDLRSFEMLFSLFPIQRHDLLLHLISFIGSGYLCQRDQGIRKKARGKPADLKTKGCQTNSERKKFDKDVLDKSSGSDPANVAVSILQQKIYHLESSRS